MTTSQERHLTPSNRYYFSRFTRPEWEERFTIIDSTAPLAPMRFKYKLKTKPEWFIVPVGRPISNNKTYYSTEKKTFKCGNTCYLIGSTYYREDSFREIEEL